MMFVLILVALIFVVIDIDCGPNSFDIDKMLPSVVKVKVQGEYNKWQGSGVFIVDNMILTAGHVTDGALEIEIITDSNEVFVADSWYFEDPKVTDLGIIIVDTNNVEPDLIFSNAVVGEAVFAIGSPYGIFPYITTGIVSAINVDNSFFGNKNLMMTDCPLNPGNSGCPILNLSNEIVGIYVGGRHFLDGFDYCIPSKICQAVIEKYEAIQRLEELE